MQKRKLPMSFDEETRSKRARKAKETLEWAKKFSSKYWFIPKKLSKDGLFTSYGPRDEILFVGDSNEDDITIKTGVLNKLQLVFNEGINFNNCCSSVSDFIPYWTNKYKEELIQADLTKEQALQLTDDYSFAYVIDASREKNLTTFPGSPSNTNNPKFFNQAPFDPGIECKFFFIVPSSLKPQHIIGAFANGALAHSLNVSEETLIINPNYDGNLSKIKNKLKINLVKEFKDCQVIYSDYNSAIAAYSTENTLASTSHAMGSRR